MNRERRPLERSIIIGCVAFIVILCCVLGFMNYLGYKDALLKRYEDYITNILVYNVAHIDGDDMAECTRTLVESEKFLETQSFMDDQMEYMDIHYLYALKPLEGEPARIMSIICAEDYYNRQNLDGENLWLGWISEEGDYDDETVALLFEIMNGRDIVFFEEDTDWGVDYTGAVSLRDSQDVPYGVLAVDIEISDIKGTIMRYAARNALVVVIVGLIFTVAFILWAKFNITNPIKKLECSVVSFAENSHGQRSVDALSFTDPDIHTHNEVEALSDAVKSMTEDMKDYVKDVLKAEDEAHEQEMKAARMAELANKDALTGIRNKMAYEREIQKLEAVVVPGSTKYGIGMIDLNFLKVINDTYGHEKGDGLIKQLSMIVCNIFAHSPVFRIGGDEFAVVLKGADLTNIDTLVQDFKDVISATSTDPEKEPWERVSAAIGVAFYDPEIDTCAADVFKRADEAMYECKKAMKAERK